jgi:hypothetical protein
MIKNNIKIKDRETFRDEMSNSHDTSHHASSIGHRNIVAVGI